MGDKANEYLQVGGNNHGQGKNCYTHSALGSIPGWGTGTTSHAFRQYVCCQGKQPANTKFFNSVNSGYKNSMSWTDAQSYCKAQGFVNLCTAKEYCPDGKNPAISGVSGDKWSPIAEKKNEYLQIGG